jgi:hypothetical protein
MCSALAPALLAAALASPAAGGQSVRVQVLRPDSVRSCPELPGGPETVLDRFLQQTCREAERDLSGETEADEQVAAAAQRYVGLVARLERRTRDLVLARRGDGIRDAEPTVTGKYLMASRMGVLRAYRAWKRSAYVYRANRSDDRAPG